MASFLQHLDDVPIGNQSLLWWIMYEYLSKKDLHFLLSSDNCPSTLHTYAEDIIYTEVCPVCKKGVWKYKHKKKLVQSIKECKQQKDRLRCDMCPNPDCNSMEIYGFIFCRYEPTKPFREKYCHYSMNLYRELDERCRKSFARRYAMMHHFRFNKYQESIDKWWCK